MRAFYKCLNKKCQNDTSGDSVYECDNCRKKYCSDCLPPVRCSACKKEWGYFWFDFSTIGWIK